MEFTKAEKKLLDVSLAQNQRGQIFLLISGILFMAIAIGVQADCYFRILPTIETSFIKSEAIISSIDVQTKCETRLKQMLLESTRHSAEGWKGFLESKFYEIFFIFWFMALFCIIAYFRGRICHGLIRKLKNSETKPD
jgi:hypothetical protein